MMIYNGKQTDVKWQENAVFRGCLSEGENSENLHQLYAEIICMDSKMEGSVSFLQCCYSVTD
jgi:hypothetical protein